MNACRPRGLRTAAVVAALVVFAWLAVLALLAAGTGLVRQGDGFSLVHWEITRLTAFALDRVTGAVSHRTASDAEVLRYFDLLDRSHSERTRAASSPDPAEAAAARSAYDADVRAAGRLRLSVENRFEQAVARAVRRAGLVERVPLFSQISLVWPPVAAGFTVPPHILIISPRSRIELKDTRLLRNDLPDSAALQIERNTEKRGVSALVDQIGGLGAYPSIVDEDDSPLGLLQTIAHEWVHEYLIFHPLGARYAQSNDMTLINETVADVVGRELGSMAYELLRLPPASPPPARPAAKHLLEFNRTLHDLRLEVDRLLKAGEVDEAERRMHEVQQQLAADGYNIRRINQAYFAFYGTYGDTAAASSPLGSKIEALRRTSPDLKSFVHRVQRIARPGDVDRLLRG